MRYANGSWVDLPCGFFVTKETRVHWILPVKKGRMLARCFDEQDRTRWCAQFPSIAQSTATTRVNSNEGWPNSISKKRFCSADGTKLTRSEPFRTIIGGKRKKANNSTKEWNLFHASIHRFDIAFTTVYNDSGARASARVNAYKALNKIFYR